jgi:hypothetical protein
MASLTGAVTPLREARLTPAAAPIPVEPAISGNGHAAAAPPRSDDHGADHAARRRRRRSASVLPQHSEPVDIPDDAAGRVEFYTLRIDADIAPPPVIPVTPPPASQPDRPLAAATTPFAEWLPVLVLAAAMVLVFVIGVVVTH